VFSFIAWGIVAATYIWPALRNRPIEQEREHQHEGQFGRIDQERLPAGQGR
jgi:hypothetical protein